MTHKLWLIGLRTYESWLRALSCSECSNKWLMTSLRHASVWPCTIRSSIETRHDLVEQAIRQYIQYRVPYSKVQSQLRIIPSILGTAPIWYYMYITILYTALYSPNMNAHVIVHGAVSIIMRYLFLVKNKISFWIFYEVSRAISDFTWLVRYFNQ